MITVVATSRGVNAIGFGERAPESIVGNAVQRNRALNQTGLDKTLLNQDDELSASSLATLIKNGIFETFELIQPRFSQTYSPQGEIKLTPAQHAASDKTMAFFAEKDIDANP